MIDPTPTDARVPSEAQRAEADRLNAALCAASKKAEREHWSFSPSETEMVAAAIAAAESRGAQMNAYMERCRAMLIIEEAVGCRHLMDKPCSCAACVVRAKVMGPPDARASAGAPQAGAQKAG